MTIADELETLGFDPEEEASADAAPEGGVADAPPGSFVLEPNLPGLYTKGIRRRRTVPICGYIGLNGHGKSLAMVRDTLPTLAEGGKVLSTVTLLDPHTGNPHPGFTRLESWRQLEEFRDGDLLLDEAHGIMDARDQGMPKHIRRHMAQYRRAGVQVRWTGIDWDNMDRRLRQITQAVVRCRGHLPRREGQVEMWSPNRAFVLTTFDASTLASSEDSRLFTEDSQRRRRAKVLHREIVIGSNPLTGTTTPAFSCYRTLDAVSWVDNSCPECGGKIAERYCKGHDLGLSGSPSSRRR